jgi:hypothetical protein
MALPLEVRGRWKSLEKNALQERALRLDRRVGLRERGFAERGL